MNEPIRVLRSEQLQHLRKMAASHAEAYLSGEIPEAWLGAAQTLPLGQVTATERPTLVPDERHDGVCAERLHRYLPLTRLQASDERLWAWLSHARFPEYVAARWKPADPNEPEKLQRHLETRWFHGRAPRARNALGRLWWGAELTSNPQLHNPRFFAQLPPADPYLYTRMLFLRQDYQFNLMENAIGRSREIAVTILHFAGECEGQGRSLSGGDFLNGIIREANLNSAVRRLELLDFPTVLEMVRTAYDTYEQSRPQRGLGPLFAAAD
ncbi:DUF6339 family protein [Deinococcus hohokamensis]|uniref:DUF6339 family protein n=1 Tax=Deinococcus hohokamensis TaxID=309883 RepID=A0ABV9ICH6_9DEIO